MLILKITEQLTPQEEELGVVPIAPVWGAKMSAAEYFKTLAPRLNNGLCPLSPQELGCTLAHLSAYAEITRQNKPALILEDDIELDVEALRSIEALVVGEPDFLHLVEYTRFRHYGRRIEDNVWVIDTSRNLTGAAAYYISVSTASALTEFHSNMFHVADDWGAFFRSYPMIVLFSPIFMHGMVKRKSTIRPYVGSNAYIGKLALVRNYCMRVTRKIRRMLTIPPPTIPHRFTDLNSAVTKNKTK